MRVCRYKQGGEISKCVCVPMWCLDFFFEKGIHYITQIDFELSVPLPFNSGITDICHCFCLSCILKDHNMTIGHTSNTQVWSALVTTPRKLTIHFTHLLARLHVY